MYRWPPIENWIFNWFAERKLIRRTRGKEYMANMYVQTLATTDICLQLRVLHSRTLQLPRPHICMVHTCISSTMYVCLCECHDR